MRRLLQAIPLLIVISIIVFGMISLAPGGPMSAFEENPNLSPEDLARLEEQLGLNQPIHERYLRWAGRIVVGDWGYSNASRRPVLTEIGERLPNTLQLMATAFIVTLRFAAVLFSPAMKSAPCPASMPSDSQAMSQSPVALRKRSMAASASVRSTA